MSRQDAARPRSSSLATSALVRRLSTILIAVTMVAAGCSGSDDSAPTSTPTSATPSTTPVPELPRYRTDGLRLTVSPSQPLVIYNVYPSRGQPELIDQVVARQWLPSTGRYGIVPTLPALAGDDITSRFRP